MRAIYQSKIGIGLMDIGVKELLQSISEKEGASLNCSSSTCTNLRGRLKSVTSLIRVVMQLNIGMISCLLNTLSFCSFTSAVVEVMFNNSSFFFLPDLFGHLKATAMVQFFWFVCSGKFLVSYY